MNYLKVVYVEWIDSQTDSGWDSETMDELGTTISIGICIRETNDSLLLANSYDPETGDNNGRIYIPLCCIKKVRTLCQLQMKTKSK